MKMQKIIEIMENIRKEKKISIVFAVFAECFSKKSIKVVQTILNKTVMNVSGKLNLDVS